MKTHDVEIVNLPQPEVIAKALRTWIESYHPDNTPGVSIRIRHSVKIEFDPVIPADHYPRLHEILSTCCRNICMQENVLVIPWEDLTDTLWQAVQSEVVTAPLPVAPALNLAAHLAHLKQSYQIDHRDLQTIALLGDPQPIAEAFVRLTLIKNEEHKDKEHTLRAGKDSETEHAFHDGRLRSWEDLYTAKTPIELNAIFDADPKAQRPESAPHRLLVLGRACIGKTTLLKYLSYQWATDVLFTDKFDAVFYIPFRKLDPARYAAAREYRVVDIINAECFNGELTEAECDALHIAIRDNPHRFLFLLDGYDEKLNTRGTSLEIVFEQLVAQRCCLISSRPHDTVELKGVDRRLEVMGFTPKDIEAYIHRFFANPQQKLTPEMVQTKAKTLIDYLKRNPNIWAIAHIPSMTEMICVLQEDIMMHTQLTVSELYHTFIRNLFQILLMREGHSRIVCTSAHIAEHTHLTQQCLEQVALQGMLDGQIILPEAIIDEAVQDVIFGTEKKDAREAQRERLQLCGFLRRVNDRREYYFIHLTVQEYFAASVIAHVLKKAGNLGSVVYQKMRQDILAHRYNPRFQLVWQFVAGILADDVRTLRRFFDILRTEPQDLLDNYSRHLLVHCLAECQEPKVLQLSRDQVLNSLLIALRDEDGNVREVAACALGNLGTAAATEEALIALVSALRDKNSDVGFAAARALGNMRAVAATPEILRTLIVMLRDEDSDIRSTAAKALGKLGVAAATEEVLIALISALRDEDRYVRRATAYALGDLGAAAATEKVLIALVNALRDEDEYVRFAVVDVFAADATEEVLTALVSMLRNENSDIRSIAADALGKLGTVAAKEEVLIALVRALRDENGYVRSAAAHALGNLGAAAATEEVLIALVNTLRDENGYVRSVAVYALVGLGAAAVTEEVLTALIRALRDEDRYVRFVAVDALVGLSAAAATEKVLIALVSVLRDKDKYVREAAARALEKLSTVAVTEKVLTALINALGDEDSDASFAAAALGKLGAAAAIEEVLIGLINMLRNENREVRKAAADALGKLGAETATEKVLITLVNMLRDRNHDIRYAAAGVLGRLSRVVTEKVLTTLVTMLQDEDKNIRSVAAKALGNLGAAVATEKVLTALLSALRDENNNVREAVAGALGNLGAAVATEKVLTALTSMLRDEDRNVREAAADALGKLGVAAATEEVLIALVSVLRDEERNVRYAAANALGKLGAAAVTEKVLTVLVNMLRDKNESYNTRSAAAYTLGKLGAAATTEKVLTALISALQDKNEDVRRAATNALGSLGAAAATEKVLIALINTLRDEDWLIRSVVANALGNMGAAAAKAEVLTALIGMLRDENRCARYAAADALGEFGAAAVTEEVLIVLVSMLRYKDKYIREVAALALGSLGATAATEKVLITLVNALRNEDWCIRSVVANVLGNMGAAAAKAEVLTALISMLRDEDRNVIRAVDDALKKLRAAAATKELLTALVSIPRDEDSDVRKYAIYVLKKIGLAHDMPTFFNFLSQDSLPTKTISVIAIALVYRFAEHRHALFCHSATCTIYCWEKGILQPLTLSPKNYAVLIHEIRKAWIKHIHLPITTSLPLAFTSLHEVATRGDLPQLHHLLTQSLNDLDNQYNLQAFTPLMCAVRAGHVEAAEMLLNADAAIHCVSSCERERSLPTETLAGAQLQTAVTLSTQHPDADTCHRLLNFFLAHRQQVSLDEFECWLATLSESGDISEAVETPQALFNRKIGQWTAMGDLTPFFCVHAVRYQTHQTNMLLAIVESSTITKGRREVTATFRTQDRFDPKVFLSMRIAFLMELLVRMSHASPSFDMPVRENKYKLLAWLKSECLFMFETLYTFQESELINELYERRQDKKKCRTLFQAIAQNIAHKLATLQPGEHYEFMSGFTDHAAYVLVTRHGDQWVAQLNNLDDEVKYSHHLRDSTDPNKLYPYYLGSWSQPELQTPASIDRFTDLLQAAFLPKGEALRLLYPAIEQTPACVHQWLPLPAQHIDNCVAHNHNAGLYYRLLQRCEGSQATAQKLYEWLIDRELELLAPWLRQQAQEIPSLASGARADAQNYRGAGGAIASLVPALESTGTDLSLSATVSVVAAPSMRSTKERIEALRVTALGAPTAAFFHLPTTGIPHAEVAQLQTVFHQSTVEAEARDEVDAIQAAIQANARDLAIDLCPQLCAPGAHGFMPPAPAAAKGAVAKGAASVAAGAK